MKVLVVGQGGREHVLCWKIAQSPHVDTLFCAPGNAGTAQTANNVSIAPLDFTRLIQFAREEEIGLTVVGPEAPLAEGIVDAFRSEGLRIFGPTKAAAELESSKVFAKNLMRSADIPTAEFQIFNDSESAEHYLNERDDRPSVIKADGLAAGKGVLVCHNRDQALRAIERIMRDMEFSTAGNQVIIEEKLNGPEVSILAFTDGRTIVPLEASQDHKAAFDGDKGPNTGGMGAYSPVPILSDEVMSEVERQILVPVVHAMKRDRRPFQGLIYAGLMLTNQGPKVLEFNVRCGDPEAQPVLMRLKSDIIEVMEATIDERLDSIGSIDWDPRPAVCVVMASKGYPGDYSKGTVINGLEKIPFSGDIQVFHAGTTLDNRNVVTDGGRVLGVTALGQSFTDAKKSAYDSVAKIDWDGAWFRKDISDKAVFHGSDNQG